MSRNRMIAALLLLLGAADWVSAQTLQIQGHISISPISIPIGPSGTADIGMTRLAFRPDVSGTLRISQINLLAITDGTFNANWVSEIKVYFEENNVVSGIGEYDHGAGLGDQRADLASGRPYTFTGSTATVSIDPSIVDFTRPPGADNYLYVVFDVSSNAVATTNLGCEITSVTWGTDAGGTGNTANPTAHNTKRNLDDYEATLTATGIAPASAAQGATDIGVLRLDYDVTDSTTTVYIDTIKLHRTAGQDNYVATAGVLLYSDVDGDGIFEPGTDDGTYIASGTMGSPTPGFVTLNPASPQAVTSTGKSFFVAVNVDAVNATIGQSFGLDVNNPSTDITFSDEIEDDNDLVPSEYAYVPGDGSGLYEYVQMGYVTSTIPTAGDSFTIDPADDGNPPSVVATIPASGATDVEAAIVIFIVFSEGMNEATMENPSNFQLVDDQANTVSGTPSYSAATQTLTFTPDSPLAWETTYTATIQSTVTDFYGNPMLADKVWAFATRQQYPTFNEPVAINNRIVPGGNQNVLIFITEPPAGPQDRITVQIFTTTGKRVATLVSNEPYQNIIGRLPLVWDGTNGRSQKLGPGMYLIQIRATKFKRVLKVLIVR